mgnify:CR=1 FL=1
MRELLENDADVRGRSANEAHEDSYAKLIHLKYRIFQSYDLVTERGTRYE